MIKEPIDNLKEITKNTYNNISKDWDEKRQYFWEPVVNFVEQIQYKENKNFLDLGCGGGRHLELAEKKGFLKNNCFGCDYSSSQLDTVKKKGFQTIQSDLIDLKIEDNFFDVIVCIAAHHHLLTREEQIISLKEMKRIIKKDGKILLANWFPDEDFLLKQIKKGKFEFVNSDKNLNLKNKGVVKVTYTYDDKKYDRYYYLFEEKELVEICSQANLNILKKEYHKGNLYFILE